LKVRTGGDEDKDGVTRRISHGGDVELSKSPILNLNSKGPTLAPEPFNPPAFNGDPTPKLSNPEMKTDPNFSDLWQMTESQLASMADFEIEHLQYGRIKWDVPVDLRGVHLDNIVRFSQSTFELYPDMDPTPEVGTGFMKPCSVMLYNVWPKGCSSMHRPSVQRENRWRASLEKYCRACDFEFLAYDNSGLLEFRVNHEKVAAYEEF